MTPFMEWNLNCLRAIAELRTPLLDTLMQGVTELGGETLERYARSAGRRSAAAATKRIPAGFSGTSRSPWASSSRPAPSPA